MRLFDVWIDFVNLRSEDYSESSRIPVMVRTDTAKRVGFKIMLEALLCRCFGELVEMMSHGLDMVVMYRLLNMYEFGNNYGPEVRNLLFIQYFGVLALICNQ
mgnify:FL=1